MRPEWKNDRSGEAEQESRKEMTALEFQASLDADGQVRVPPHVVAQLQHVPSFRVLVLVPQNEEDEAWNRAAEEDFFRGYADSDSIYDDVQTGHDSAA
jgi:hypothetical protein